MQSSIKFGLTQTKLKPLHMNDARLTKNSCHATSTIMTLIVIAYMLVCWNQTENNKM